MPGPIVFLALVCFLFFTFRNREGTSMDALAATVVSLPLWNYAQSLYIMAFSDHYNPAAILILGAMSFVLALPLGWLIGYVVAPLMYKSCSKSGWNRYRIALFWHGAVYLLARLLDSWEFYNERIVTFAAYPGLYADMFVVPSLVGTLVYAYRTRVPMSVAETVSA